MINAHKIKSMFLTLAVLSSTAVFSAEDNNLNEYYNGVFMGEKKTPNYAGPLDPRTEISSSGLILLDDIFKDQYLNRQIENVPFTLHDYWFNEVVEKSTCPDTTLNENMDYIRYLYRLVTMSYLFEGVKLNNKMASQLGGKNICSVSFKEVFQGCTPESTDMKKFYDRVNGKFINEIEKNHTPQLSKKDMASFMDEFQESTSLTTNPTFARLHDWCIANKKNCRTLKTEEIKAALGDFCNDDKKMMKVVCSEKDSFYGLSAISTPTELIKSSNAFNLINQTGMGEECLRRYGKLFQNKETPYTSLTKQYPLMYSYLLKTNATYPQGELFLPGALKEFDMKGLSDFLTALKPPKVQPVVIVRAKPKPKPVPVVVVAPKVEVKAPEVIPVVVPEPEKPKISEFEHGVVEMKEKNLSSYSLDMDNFRDDFEFTSEMIAELSGPIKKFQTRSALNDMKSYDLLGSVEAPVGLVFLKFLIDTENHQGLYNIVQVLGDKFYVSNDIEKKTTPHYIELKNDASTKNRWTIIMLKK